MKFTFSSFLNSSLTIYFRFCFILRCGYVVSATTTLQNFALALFWSLPSNLHSNLPCFIKFTSFSVFLAQRQLVDHSLMQSSQKLITRTWFGYRMRSFLKKMHISGGKLTFPPEIAQSYLVACWALELHNSTSQDSSRKLYNSSQQDCSAQVLCNPRQQSTSLPKNYANLLGNHSSSILEMNIFSH